MNIPVKISSYAERLLGGPFRAEVQKQAPAPRPERASTLYCPQRRTEHLNHAHIWLAEHGRNLVGYARAHGLSQTLLFNAVRYARANPQAREWPRGPIGCRRQISEAQLVALRRAYCSPQGRTLHQIADECGVSRAALNHYFSKWRRAGTVGL